MRSLISFLVLLTIKVLSKLFYRFKIGWPDNDPNFNWKEIKLIILLNHTSLYEFLYIGFLPVGFLWKLARRMVAPAADKTMNRLVVGSFFKLLSPGLVSISRKKDDTWEEFLDRIYEDSVIFISPEGRMMRKTGLDLEGREMSVKSGVLDILAGLNKGSIMFAYSGGLHHVQIPDEKTFPKLFKTLKMDLEMIPIQQYKAMFTQPVSSDQWKKEVMDDLQHRLETKIPQ